MAKKVVATLRDKTAGKSFAKVIKAVKSPKTGRGRNGSNGRITKCFESIVLQAKNII
jgi:hypothetical protein